MGYPLVGGEGGGGDNLQIWTVAVSILNKQLQSASNGLSCTFSTRHGTNNSSLWEAKLDTKCHTGCQTWTDFLE